MAEAQPAEFAQATDLEQAFDVFNALSERLTLAYGQLEARVAMLSDQLDSTRRDRLRERAQKEHLADQLGVLLEALPAAVVLVDMRDRIDRFNPAAEQLFPGLAWGRRWSEVKAEVVGADEKEAGLRAILNFGHTFGHAIEAGLGYGRWLHGEAVGCGMVMAAELSARLGLVDRGFVERLASLVQRAGLPVVAPALGADRYLELMRIDKKAEGGEIRFVVIDTPGRAIVRPAPDALVREVIEARCAAVA